MKSIDGELEVVEFVVNLDVVVVVRGGSCNSINGSWSGNRGDGGRGDRAACSSSSISRSSCCCSIVFFKTKVTVLSDYTASTVF